MQYLGQDEYNPMTGVGYLGEVRLGADGQLYEWVQGIDGLGNPVGFWRALRRRLRRIGRGILRTALPLVRRFAPFVPGVGPLVSAGLPLLRQFAPRARRVARFVPGVDPGAATAFAPAMAVSTGTMAPGAAMSPTDYPGAGVPAAPADGSASAEPQQATVEGYAGLGALYQAPDGSLYQVQGLDDEDDLRGLEEEDELRGFAQDEDLRGLMQDQELQGLEEEELQGLAQEELQGLAQEELQGLAQEDDLRGFAADDELQGLDQGYVRQEEVSGLEGYIPTPQPQTRWFAPPALPPALWRPLW